MPRCWACQTNWWTFLMSGVKRVRRREMMASRRIVIKGFNILYYVPSTKSQIDVNRAMVLYINIFQVSRLRGHLPYCPLTSLFHHVVMSRLFSVRPSIVLWRSVHKAICNSFEEQTSWPTTPLCSNKQAFNHCVFPQWLFTGKRKAD